MAMIKSRVACAIFGAGAVATLLAVGCGNGGGSTYLGDGGPSGGSPAAGGASGGDGNGGTSTGGSSTPADGGAGGAGGSASGGVSGSSSGQGGSNAGEGGSASGQGGSSAGEGGSASGQGGSSAGEAGSSPGQGGSAGDGGASSGQGGSSSGASGAGGASGGGAVGGTGGADDILFKEDFEDGDLDGWGTGPAQSAYTITTTTAAEGTERSLLKAYTGKGGNYAGPNYQFPDGIKPSRVTFWVRLAANSNTVVVAFSSDPDALDHFFVFGLHHQYILGCGPTPQIPIADGWYPVEVTLNWSNKTFRCSFNGGTPSELQPMTGPIRRLDLFEPGDFASGSAWDEIVFYR